MQFIALLVIAFIATVSAFSFNSRLNVPTLNRSNAIPKSVFFMADEPEDKFEPEFKPEDPKLFDMNRIVRLGRSRDQVSYPNPNYNPNPNPNELLDPCPFREDA
jgi:hypothetical protein